MSLSCDVALFCSHYSQNIIPLARDVSRRGSLAVGAMVNKREMGILVSTDDGNLRLFDPTPRAACYTQLVSCTADFHLGGVVGLFIRVPLADTDKTRKVARHGSLFGTSDGGVALLVPMSTKGMRMKRLKTLQTAMVSDICIYMWHIDCNCLYMRDCPPHSQMHCHIWPVSILSIFEMFARTPLEYQVQ